MATIYIDSCFDEHDAFLKCTPEVMLDPSEIEIVGDGGKLTL
jgi:hypothetical protein